MRKTKKAKVGEQPARREVKVVTLADAARRAVPKVRYGTGFPSLDDVLGGGLVRGASYLFYSDPGLGKTTLCLQMADALARCGLSTIVACGEQVAGDIEVLSKRLGVGSRERKLISVFGLEGDAYRVVDQAVKTRPALLIVDSLQTGFVSDVGGDVGSTTQVMALVNWYTSFGKAENVAIALINHTLRDGSSAGPMAVEHLVDAKIHLSHFAREEFYCLRKIEAEKNRYGALKRALFAFDGDGLRDLRLVETVVSAPASDPVVAEARTKKRKRPGSTASADAPRPRPSPKSAAAVEVE